MKPNLLNSFFTKKAVMLLLIVDATINNTFGQTPVCRNAQLEMAASAVGAVNPTTNGPSVANQVITFRENTNNPSGTTFANYAPEVKATYSISNQQFTNVTGLSGDYANGIVFGSGINSTAAPLYDNMGAVLSSAAVNFSSTPNNIGAGIDLNLNYGANLKLATRPLQNATASLTGSYYYGDLTITFNQGVDYPILQMADFGGFVTSGTSHAFSLQAKVISGQTLTKLSGDAGVTVVGADSIASVVSGNTAATNFLDGSFMVNGTGVTSITLKLYIKGHDALGAWSATGAGNTGLEQMVIGVTVPDLVPTTPVPNASALFNACPATTVDLTKNQPAAIAGQTYEWHSVATSPSAGTLISTPTAQTGTGPFYLYSKDNLTGCFSLASAAVNATYINCIYDISCVGTQIFREDFGSTNSNLPYGVSGAEHPFDSTFCLNGYITNTTVGYSPLGGAQTGLNFTGDVSGDGDTGTHFLYHFSGVGGALCSNAVGDAAWLSTATINVVAGQTYEYSYYYRKQNTAGSNTVIQQQVVPASGTITQLSATNNAIQNAAWVKNTMVFTASASGPVTLRLNNMLGPVGGNDFGIDNITLTAVPLPAAVPTTTSLTNNCPSTTYNLPAAEPDPVANYSYEWHTVATNPSASTKVTNPSAASASGPFYLYIVGPGTDACYNSASVPVTVSQIDCTCPAPPFSVYEYNRTGTWSTNAPYTITGQTTTNTTINQSTAGTFSSNGVLWRLLATNVSPDASGKIKIDLLPTAATTGTFLAADAMLVTNGFDSFIIDNKSANGYATTGTWTNQNFTGAYLGNEDFSTAPHTGKTASWTFAGLPKASTLPTPTPTATTLANSCPDLTYNLLQLNPATVLPIGYSYQWHSGTPSTAANLISNAGAATGTGPFYLSIDGPAGCYSASSTPVTTTTVACPPAFGCTGNSYLFQNLPTDFYAIDINTGATTLIAADLAGTTSTIGLNGVGYNPTDGYIWGHIQSSNKIARVAADGSTTLFTIPGLPTSGTYNTGDVSSAGILYLTTTSTTTMYRVDVNPSSPTYLQLLTPNLTVGSFAYNDMAFNPIDGNLYLLSATRQLIRINPTTGATTNLGIVTGGGIINDTFGAVYFDNAGNFYVSSNTSGKIFQIPGTSSGSLTSTLYATSSGNANNDGARCNTAPLCTVPTSPVATNTSISNTCPATTVNLTSYQPAPVSGISYEWHTVSKNPLSTTLIANPTSITANGTYYLFAKSDVGSCYSATASAVNVTIYNPCLDCDGDGVPDQSDIDDDNDGVLDITENCTIPQPQNIGTTNATIGGTANVTKTGSTTIAYSAVSGTSNILFSGTLVSVGNHLGPTPDFGTAKLTFPNPTTNVGFYVDAMEFGTEYVEFEVLPPFTGTPTVSYFSPVQNGTLSQISATKWRVTSGVNCANSGACTSGGTIQITGGFYSSVQITGGSGTANTWNKNIYVRLGDAVVQGSCITDVDNDGIPNSCDLDSDGDGCSDAVEAGNVTLLTSPYASTSVFQSTPPANTTSTGYTQYALNAAVNACDDCDSDGVPNIFDIDDDNDGVLDSIEGCNATNIVTNGDFSGGSNSWISTNFSSFSGAATYTYDANDAIVIDGSLSQSITGLNTVVNPDGFIPLKFDFTPINNSAANILINVLLNGTIYSTINIPTTINNASTIAVSNGAILTPALSTLPNNTPTTVTLLIPKGTIPNTASLTFNVTNCSGCAIPDDDFTLDNISISCSVDTDNDGIPNTCDLDSDGDGCSDAVEAGNALLNTPYASITDYPTATPSITTSTGYSFALNKDINGCDDCDGDGVPNIYDIDDDNDGVLDSVENLSGNPLIANSNSGTGAMQDSYYFFNWTDPTFSNGLQNGDGQTFNLPGGIVINATFSNVSANMSTAVIRDMPTDWFGSPSLYTRYNTAGTSESIKITTNGTSTYSYSVNWTATKNGQPFALDLLALDAEANRGNEPSTYTTNGDNWRTLETYDAPVITGIGTKTYTTSNTLNGTMLNASYGATKIDISTGGVAGASGVAFAIFLPSDTDSDGIPNTCDLDSDGDGCSDAYEAGATTDVTSNFVFAGAVGNNGLINTLENNDTPTATTSYTSTYTTNALNKTIKSCCGALTAGPDKTACQFGSATMAGVAGPGTNTWTAQTGNPGTAVITTPSSATTTITGFTVPGVYNFIWSNGSCADTTKITVTAKPVAGFDQTVCQFTSATMSASGTGVWSAVTLPANPAVAIFTPNNSATAVITGLTVAGDYNFVWTSNGCTDTVKVTVTPKPIAGPDQTGICAGSTASLSGSPTTGTWAALASNPPGGTVGTTNAGMATASFTNTAVGVYKFIYTANSCTDTMSVTVNPKPFAGVDIPAICAGSSTTITGAPDTGTWSALATNPTGATLGTTASGAAAVSFATSTASGTFSFIYTVNGCKDTVNVTVNALPAVPVTTTTQPTCVKNDGEIEVTSPLGANYTYSIDGSGFQVSPIFDNLPQGIYTITVKDNATGCINAGSPITINAAIPITPTPTLSPSGPQVTCAGTPITLTSSVANSYVWYKDGIQIPGASAQTYSASVAGTYTVRTVATGSCASLESAPITLTVNPLPNVSVTPNGPTTFCSGGSVGLDLTASGGTGLTYQWLKDGVNIGGATSATYSATQSGSYTVKVTNAEGCSATSTAIPVLVNALPTAVIANGANVATSCGVSAVLSATTNAGAPSYKWYKNGVLISGATAATYPATPPASGSDSYTVVITDDNTGCVSAVSAATRVFATPAATSGSQSVCQGSAVTITSTASETTYLWKKDGVAAPGTNNQMTYSATVTGSYTCDVVVGGLTVTTCPITITVSPLPTPAINATSGTSICAPGTIPLTSSGVFASYQWKLGGNNIPGANAATYTATQSGVYTLEVKNGAGCLAESAPITVAIEALPASPTPKANTIENVCPAQTVNLASLEPTPAAGTTLEWHTTNASNSALVPDKTKAVEGTYYLFAKGSAPNSCYSLASLPVTVVINTCPDTVIVQPTCQTCPTPKVCPTANDLPTTGTVTYKQCPITSTGTTTATSQGSLVIDALGCAIWTPNGSQTDTVKTCLIKCVGTKCDTTYLVIPPPIPVADTIKVTPACKDCPTPKICPTGDDLPTVGAVTYKQCSPTSTGTRTVASQGTLSVDANGCAIWTPNGTQTETIKTCVIKCVGAVCDTTYIVIDPPKISPIPDVNQTYVNVPVPGDVSTNDKDIPTGSTYGNPPANTSNPDGGANTPIVGPDGKYTFTTDKPGLYTFEVPITLPDGTVKTTTLTITVLDVNKPDNIPVANVDIASTPPATPVTIKTLANDAPGNPGVPLVPSSVTVTDQPANGSTSILPNGDIIYTPNPGFVGTDTLTYTVQDANGNTATAKQIITVLPPNAPNTTVATDEYATTPNNTPVNGNAKTNDIDPEGNAQTITPQSTTIPGKGTLVLASDGTYTFTPVPGFSGPVEFPYTTTDALGATAKATIHILVAPPVPSPIPDVNQTYVNVPVNGDVSTNDKNIPTGSTYSNPPTNPSNPDGGVNTPVVGPDGKYTFITDKPGVYTFEVPITLPDGTKTTTTLTITVLDTTKPDNVPVANVDIASTPPATPVTIKTLANDAPSNPGVPLVPSSVTIIDPPANGSTSVLPNGDIIYTPNSGFVGTDTLTYSVIDANGNTATAKQIITVLPPNAPNTTVAADDYVTTPNNTPVNGNAKTNDSDPEGNTQTITPQTTSIPGKGTLVLASDGTYTFTPDPGFSGPVEFPYTTTDALGATAKATIHILVAPPVPNPIPDVNQTYVNVPVPGDVSTNDKDIPTGSTYGNPPTNPSNPDGGANTPVVGPDGKYTFTTDKPGVYTFEVPITLPDGSKTTTTLTITVLDTTKPDNVPVANVDIASTPPATPVNVKTLANDAPSNPGVPLVPGSVTVVDPPANGSTSVLPNGDIIYTPNPGFVGTDTLTYTVQDANGNTATAKQIITVLPPNAPNSTVAADDYASTTSGVPVSGNAKTNDSDPEGHSQTITPQTTTIPGKGTLVLASDGSFTFTPEPGFTGPIEFPYTTTDALGATAKATIHILVGPPLPSPIPDVNQTYVNVPVTGDVSTNDKDIPAGSTYGNPPANPANPGTAVPVVNTDGTYTFTSSVPGVFTFEVPITMPDGSKTTATLTITVLDAAKPDNVPVANVDIASTPPATPVTIKTLANDAPGNPGVPLVPGSVTVIVPPANGSISVLPNGDIIYTPNPGFVGTDTLTYTVQDANGNTATAKQIITVLPANAKNTTVAADDYSSTKYATPVSGNAKTNDSDPEGESQSITPQSTNIPGKGTLVLASDGSFTFTPAPGFSGPVEFPYTTTDALGATATATIHILVAPPIPVDDVNSTPANQTKTGDVSTNDINLPTPANGTTYGTPTPAAGNSNPAGAVVTLTMNPDGTYSFISDKIGVYTYDVPITLPDGTTTTSKLTITVTAPLPVDLISFDGKQFEEQVNLTWKVANEKEFSHFEVQRSADAKEFGAIGKVNASKSNIYNFIDINPIEGQNYYRLKMVDLDGSFILSKTVNVSFERNNEYISVENPANNGEFKVMTNLKNPRFTLLNSLGQIVEISITESRISNFVIKTNSAAGVYYLNIVSNNKVVTRKVIMP